MYMNNEHDTAVIFFFNDTATTEIYTLSLHDALPILQAARGDRDLRRVPLHAHGEDPAPRPDPAGPLAADRKSTRLNSSHSQISYAVFCLKKKKPLLVWWTPDLRLQKSIIT